MQSDEMSANKRYVVKPITMDDGRVRYYVQDTALGYCTNPTTKAAARADAFERNRHEAKPVTYRGSARRHGAR